MSYLAEQQYVEAEQKAAILALIEELNREEEQAVLDVVDTFAA